MVNLKYILNLKYWKSKAVVCLYVVENLYWNVRKIDRKKVYFRSKLLLQPSSESPQLSQSFPGGSMHRNNSEFIHIIHYPIHHHLVAYQHTTTSFFQQFFFYATIASVIFHAFYSWCRTQWPAIFILLKATFTARLQAKGLCKITYGRFLVNFQKKFQNSYFYRTPQDGCFRKNALLPAKLFMF